MPGADLRQRLRRLLFLMPYAVRHPGAPLGELAQLVELSEAELIEELDFLLMVGQPPFAPDDCIDIRVEGGRVYVELDQAFNKPPRLTAFEALALAAATRGLAGEGADAVSKALAKIEAALPQGLLPLYRELSARFEVAQVPAEVEAVARLRKAIAERREVALDYFAESRGEAARRPVRPRELRYAQGHWYLSAFCLTRNDDRLFRVDRMRSVELTDRPFDPLPPENRERAREPGEPPPPPKDPAFTPARLRLHGGAAVRYAAERFGGVGLALEGPEQAMLTLSGPADSWAVSFCLSFGGAAELLEPPVLREQLREKLEATRALYAA